MTIRNAATDHPILKLLAERWSPYAFEDRPVPEADLRSLFEAAAGLSARVVKPLDLIK